jgi:pantoate--beta-alanine ligase
VVVSIFVNPLQFGPQEDFARYPKNLERDLEHLQPMSVAWVFAPGTQEMYPDGPSLTRVVVPALSAVLCGVSRPGHFEGVATVVTKLYHIVTPDVMVFGEKDWQQLTIIRRLVHDLNIPVAIEAVPTVREADGLAMSSRNRYLTPEERQRAPALFQSLLRARKLSERGERRVDVLSQAVRAHLADAGVTPEYVEIFHPDTLQPWRQQVDGPARIALAARIGQARLIDNLALSTAEPS